MNIDFKPRHYDEWYENLRGVHGLVFTLSLLQYPCLLETVIWNESRTLEPDNASKLIVLFDS